MTRQLRTFVLGAATMCVAACSGPHPTTAAAPIPSCVVGASHPSVGATASVASMAPVDPAHVPEPANAVERLAFAQVYETLIDVDCEGRARPALAASWTLDPTKTRITLTLRDGAQFWTGEPLTTASVLAAWRATATGPSSSAWLAHLLAGGATIVDDHTLIVSLPDTSWLVLGEPALAVYERQPTAEWPVGSGPYRVAPSSADTPRGALLLAASAASDPSLQIRPLPSGDPRDAIDAGADVLVTGDPVVVSYAAAHANLVAVPLPWTRTYALAMPGPAPRIARVLLGADSASHELRRSLAHDAVHAEARAAQPPSWWNGSASCGAIPDAASATHTTIGGSNRIAYLRDDPVARGLVERLVALDPRTVAAGLAPGDFTRMLHDGRDLAYVFELPRVSLSACAGLRELRLAAPWLASGIATDSTLVALIDTRETAIVNRDRVSAAIDWNGTLHFGGVVRQP